MLFVCENNLYSMGMALERAEAETNIARKAAAYRMPGVAVDGMDVVAVEAAAREAVERIRAGGGPQFPRMPHLPLPRPLDVRRPSLPHQGGDRDVAPQGADRRASRAGCAKAASRTRTTSPRIEAEADAEIDAAVAFAEAGTPEPVEELERFVTMEQVP